MSLLLETIRVVDGCWMNLKYHLKRSADSSFALFGESVQIDFESIIIPPEYRIGIVKCRILYDTKIRKIEFEHYTIRPISTLKLVYDNHIDYSHKLANRLELSNLLAQKEGADEILIVKNGQLTDISYANVVLKIENILYTPKNCLLKGTRRQQLLDLGIIQEQELTVTDLSKATSVILINAMLGLEDGIEIMVDKIYQ
jgi:4-amino-4-deoxychorismate lyase